MEEEICKKEEEMDERGKGKVGGGRDGGKMKVERK